MQLMWKTGLKWRGCVIEPMQIFNYAHAHSCAIIDDKHNSVLAVLTVFQVLSNDKAQENTRENSIYYNFRSHSPR